MARYTKKNPKQLGLNFAGGAPPEEDPHLERVSAKIARHILAFVDEVARGSGTFHMSDLQEHIAEKVPGCAPDSPSRILRDLRKRGEIDYECIDRKNSLYEVY